MKKIHGPAIFLAQFIGDEAPFNNLQNILAWAASLGYRGVQIPTWDKRIFDLEKAAEAKPTAMNFCKPAPMPGYQLPSYPRIYRGNW